MDPSCTQQVGAKLRKRPLIRRQIPASSKSSTIYVSSRSPFMSIVKRAQKLLDKSLRNTAAAPRNATLHSRVAALERGAGSGSGPGTTQGGTVVRVLATGKAIERAVHAASWFEQRGDCAVEMRTRTTATVDDVTVAGDDDCFGAEDESRLRKLSVLEICISLK
ncbi:hypothetical protein ESCO_004086 [Escovopsis weberi]|uniref:Uncharacterized protein n=1 Tax=Escovopsis weberi TaxID=150374 RepID=A0A0M8MXV3_ESCWE|nr:hypothetical protein ESCO_004086 [Escovopsis weberi]